MYECVCDWMRIGVHVCDEGGGRYSGLHLRVMIMAFFTVKIEERRVGKECRSRWSR